MRVVFKKSFVKKLDKCSEKIKIQIFGRLKIFRENPNDLLLSRHRLSGKLARYESINLSGDLRAIFVFYAEDDLAVFYLLGTHSELYK